MQLSVTFRHMDASEAVKEYAREKVEKVKKYFPDPIMVHVVFTVERGYQHSCDVHIQLHNGLLITGREITEDMYSSIDLVMAQIERRVRRYKDKIRHHKSREDLSTIPVAYHVIEEQFATATGDELPATTSPPPSDGFKITKTDRIPARPLTVEEAVLQMNLLHDTFLVFRNQKSGHINVVYKRADGSYGLIETGAPT